MTNAQSIGIEAQLAALKAENDRLRAKIDAGQNRKVTMKVSEKGAVSVYGLGRFPVTLYQTQWHKLLGERDAILEFLKDNSHLLASKSDQA